MWYAKYSVYGNLKKSMQNNIVISLTILHIEQHRPIRHSLVENCFFYQVRTTSRDIKKKHYIAVTGGQQK
jgi:hypothetical protein